MPAGDKQRRQNFFDRFSRWVSKKAGSPAAATLATLMVVIWGVTGPIFHFSDTWQLIMNTISSIITFVMVFLIQSSQNRDTGAIQLKLDEMIRATRGAHNELVDVEALSDKEIETLHKRYEKLRDNAERRRREGRSDVDTPETHQPG